MPCCACALHSALAGKLSGMWNHRGMAFCTFGCLGGLGGAIGNPSVTPDINLPPPAFSVSDDRSAYIGPVQHLRDQAQHFLDCSEPGGATVLDR